MSLLELTVATALMTTVAAAVAVLLRGAHAGWLAHDGDLARLESAHALVRHVVRLVRQADSVVSISAAADTSGALSVQMPSGTTYAWDHNGATSEVNFGVTTATNLLAEAITEFKLTGYKADGTTTTTVPAEIQAVQCQVKVTLPRESGASRTVSARAWMRAW